MNQEMLAALVHNCRLIYLDEVDSTNNYAKRLITNNEFGFEFDAITEENRHYGGPIAIVANSQTAGRGRLGKSFVSPKDTGIYLSIIMDAPIPANNLPLVTMATAVSVSRAIENITRESAQIKWVNDLYLRDKKICGILVEGRTETTNHREQINAASSASTSAPGAVSTSAADAASTSAPASAYASETAIEKIIIGIGVNCFPSEYPSEIKEIAGPISEEPGTFSRSELAATIINEVVSVIENIKNNKALMEVLLEYYNNCMTPELIPPELIPPEFTRLRLEHATH